MFLTQLFKHWVGQMAVYLRSGAAQAPRSPFNGNVGIGTDAPQGNLHVGSQVSFLDSGANSIISNSGNHQRLVIASGNTHVSDIQFRKASGTKNSGVIRYDENQDMRFYTDGTEKVRIEAAGNVGIGTDRFQHRPSITSETRRAMRILAAALLRQTNNRLWFWCSRWILECYAFSMECFKD